MSITLFSGRKGHVSVGLSEGESEEHPFQKGVEFKPEEGKGICHSVEGFANRSCLLF